MTIDYARALRETKAADRFSPEQRAFLDCVRDTRGSIVLMAVAGSGKTTTILEAAKHIRGGCAILAYNKKIADEIKGKLERDGVDWRVARAGTVHSFGFGAYRKRFENVKVEENKVAYIADKLITQVDAQPSGDTPDPLGAYRSGICRLVSLAKQVLIGVTTGMHNVAAWQGLISHHDLDFGAADDDDAIADAIRVLKANNANTDEIDFDDMIYMPLLLRLRFWQYGAVFLDEAQDTNNARRELCKRMLRPGGRLIAVGDPHQAIYGFTGADNDSLDIICDEFSASTMPLSVTFRCPKNVVAFAQQWVSHIHAADTAQDGEVGVTTFADIIAADKQRQALTAILCRNVAPMITAAFALIRAGVSCRVEGRDIGKQLLKIINRWRIVKLDTFETKLDAYAQKERAKLTARNAKDNAFAALDDRVGTIRTLIEQCRERGAQTVDDLRRAVDTLFGDDVTGQLVLSTIHKSKGREWRHVVLLDREELYAKACQRSASMPWQVEQEQNLMYVACTRALETLHDVTSLTLPTTTPKLPFDEKAKRSRRAHQGGSKCGMTFTPTNVRNAATCGSIFCRKFPTAAMTTHIIAPNAASKAAFITTAAIFRCRVTTACA